MTDRPRSLTLRMILTVVILGVLLGLALALGVSVGTSGHDWEQWCRLLTGRETSPMFDAIVWRIRLPRVLVAALSGAVLSLGGLVFQALLRNPLAEPYILGVSGGSAIGAIIGILMGLSRFPGVSLTAFLGGMVTLAMVLFMVSGKNPVKKDSLILSGVMVNAFCSALIMFMISMTQNNTIHSIMFWLMGDLTSADMPQAGIFAVMVAPCFFLIFICSHLMNLMLLGEDSAHALGIPVQQIGFILVIVTSFMISASVCQCGLLGFVGLVIPHIFRLALGPDHRILVPCCILGGGAYLVLCDLLARVVPVQGEIPVGVVTAMIGAPAFIILLKKNNRGGLS